LKQACTNSLKKASELGFKSIAYTAISSGKYGVPNMICAQMMLASFDEYAKNRKQGSGDKNDSIDEIRVTDEDEETLKAFLSEIEKKEAKTKKSSYA